MMMVISYFMTIIEHRKPQDTSKPLPDTNAFVQVYQKYRRCFRPGSCTFNFEMDITQSPDGPSPFYHVIEGQTFIHLNWKLMLPTVKLLCFKCKHMKPESEDITLHHERTNWSKNKTLFPTWTNSGVPMWCVVMNYKCPCCKSTVTVNDGELLATLPAHVRNMYPVDPRYASGTFHLHKDITDGLDSFMTTYVNAGFVSKLLYKKRGIVYTEKCMTYLSQNPKIDFVSYDDFKGSTYPPSANSLRK
jgi:hypothetical protein